MYNITICIPTYKRPEMLEELVLSINNVNINYDIINNVEIIIVDNDIEGSAENKVKELAQILKNNITIEYHLYSKKGLANIRNELLNIALKKKNDYIISIDDDEYVSKDWLNQLVNTIVVNNGDIALGPVIPVFKESPPSYIKNWFKSPDFDDQKKINFFRSGQYIISTGFVNKYQLKFDERFNTRGYEDIYFGMTALKKGARIFWSKYAYVYETIPKTRTNIKWILKRKYRGAVNYTYVQKLEKEYFKLLKKIIVSFLYIFLGIISMPLFVTKHRLRYCGLLKFIEGIGGIAGLLNLKSEGY